MADKSAQEHIFDIHDRCVNLAWGAALYSTFILTKCNLIELQEAFVHPPKIMAMPDTKGQKWIRSAFGSEVYEAMNRDYVYLGCSDMGKSVQAVLTNHEDAILQVCGSPFRAVNVRAWETKHEARDFGPSAWDQDGLAPGHLKLMIYLEGLGGDIGSLELVDLGFIVGPKGLAVIFQNSVITHRAIPARSGGTRPVIEITL